MFRDKKYIITGIIIIILLVGNVYQINLFNQIVNDEERASHVAAERMMTRIQWMEHYLELFIESIDNGLYGVEEINTWGGILHNSVDVNYFSSELINIDFRYSGRPQHISPHYLEGNLDKMKDIDYILSTLRRRLNSINEDFLKSNEGTFDISNESMEELKTVHELYSLLSEIIEIEDEMIIDKMEMIRLIEPLKRIDASDERWKFMQEKYITNEEEK